ncbi:gliding motility-associated lipoprotein GldD [Cyclobacterium xiamenense]|uniref:Gliding motility-associated lipoprotein GldD n=2 Tax=Cyclobacterium xiamenense TaxID=1297121 RepID=A0A1H6W4V7_9BACT|nr:gliding motility-associated lipoprotein GldD [Cyclobacterium xiamenense]
MMRKKHRSGNAARHPAMGGMALLFLLILVACGETYVPKPMGYNRIDLPEREFEALEMDLPYTFQHSTHLQVEPDSFNMAEKNWINLHYSSLGARVHLTYKPITGGRQNLKSYLDDALTLTFKHQIKAYGIDESVVRTPTGYTGLVSELSGEVPTQFQFFVTDSTAHFLRGALYFETAVKNDSLAPVIEYIKTDMMHLINSVEFN